MKRSVRILALLFIISIVFFAMPVFVPTWKWYWISSAVIGLPLLAVWGQYFYSKFHNGYSGSTGEGLGLVFIGIITLSFLVGMITRFCIWLIETMLAVLYVIPSHPG